eukprot:2301338-Amphidinium_carterae.1
MPEVLYQCQYEFVSWQHVLFERCADAEHLQVQSKCAEILAEPVWPRDQSMVCAVHARVGYPTGVIVRCRLTQHLTSARVCSVGVELCCKNTQHTQRSEQLLIHLSWFKPMIFKQQAGLEQSSELLWVRSVWMLL